MTIQECYERMGADYNDVISRLRSDRLVKKFALKFPADGSCRELSDALAEGDNTRAFRAAHTMKGVCRNLGFARLAVPVEALTEVLRPGHEAELASADLHAMFAAVQKEYALTLETIKAFEAEQE